MPHGPQRRASLSAVLLTFLAAPLPLVAQAPNDTGHWVSTWATSLELAPTQMETPKVPSGVVAPDFSKMKPPGLPVPANLSDQTVRMIAHVSIGGTRLRVQLSNAIGRRAVTLNEVRIAPRLTGSSVDAGRSHLLTFGGKTAVTLPPGALIASDPIDFALKPASDLAVSLYVHDPSGPPTAHIIGLHTGYVSKGNTTASPSLQHPDQITSYLWLSSIDVQTKPGAFSIVALGDSITDGFRTSMDGDHAWPTLLAKRLLQAKTALPVSVLNQGVSGNEVLRDGAGVSALARFDRDVLSRPGVRWIILLEGINDINIHGQVNGPSALQADDLITAYREIIARAHSYGIRVMGATITPEEGVWLALPTGEAKRQRINAWIRTSHAFDAVVDFDKVLRDPAHEGRLRQEFNPGDNIHPNDTGNQAMADAVDLRALLK